MRHYVEFFNIFISVLPKKGPEIVGVRPQYDVGDVVNVTCHAGPSRPAGVVEWLINGDHVRIYNVWSNQVLWLT